MNHPLLAIVGPTAVGKSHLVMQLAKDFQGEIVNADSRQFYRFMDIGTAKPTSDDRAEVPHHLIDIVDPDDEFSLALFLPKANEAIDQVRGRGNLPILVGGSGQYIWGLLEGWRVPEVPLDSQLRERLLQRAEAEGPDRLYRELTEVDPEAAQRIDPRNLRRVVRALEVTYTLGTPSSQARGKGSSPGPALIIGLTLEREALYRRIDERVDVMVQQGWVQEVQRLLSMHYTFQLPSMSGIGYREIGSYLEGYISLNEAIQKTKYRSHRFVRHQHAWFNPKDPRIHWLQAGPDVKEEAAAALLQFLKKENPGLC